MSKAKHYIYRNLNAGGFSSKYRGIVTDRFGSTHPRSPTGFVGSPEFRVSQAVSERIKESGKRQVHAYVVSNSYSTVTSKMPPEMVASLPTLRYHPKFDTQFTASDSTSLDGTRGVIFMDDKAFIIPADNRGDDAWDWWSNIFKEILT